MYHKSKYMQYMIKKEFSFFVAVHIKYNETFFFILAELHS